MRFGITGSYHRPGFTIAELLVAMAVFALVSVMLAFPLLSALGYIEKASARQQAQVSANQAVQQIANELSTAMYVFDVPPDGSWVAFLCENSSASAQNLGLPMDVTSSAVSYVRYARMLDFPWVSTGTSTLPIWGLINPDYLANSATDSNIYSHYWLPFYANPGIGTPNPYIITRFAPVLTDPRSSWANIWQQPLSTSLLNPHPYFATLPASLDATYPMSGYTATNRGLLWRQFQDDMGAVTPVGPEWDIPRFQATPLRLASESLVLQVDASGFTLPTMAVARYPFWCGRNLDLDNLSDSQLGTLYPGLALSNIDSLLQSWTPLYPTRRMNPAWQSGSSPGVINPFGYQVHIYDVNGNCRYGTNYSSTGSNYSMINTRHFMDWPPIDRPDWSAASSYLWSQNAISRQRLEGKLVFAQPVVPSPLAAQQSPAGLQLQLPTNYQTSFAGTPGIFVAQNQQLQLPSNYTACMPVILPIPAGSWKPYLARLVTPPQQITLTNQSNYSETFHLVNKTPSQLGIDEFCASTTTNLNAGGKTTALWQANVAYSVGTIVQPTTLSGYYYICTVAGTSGATQPLWPSWPASGTISDGGIAGIGGVTWKIVPPVYRELSFGVPQAGSWSGTTWGISIQNAPQALYTISDLQPDDVVVASYSTKAVIDLALTVSRQDHAGQLAFSRQDFVVNRRITAENALKRARDNR